MANLTAEARARLDYAVNSTDRFPTRSVGLDDLRSALATIDAQAAEIARLKAEVTRLLSQRNSR